MVGEDSMQYVLIQNMKSKSILAGLTIVIFLLAVAYPSLAIKISDGMYSIKSHTDQDGIVEVRGNRYRSIDLDETSSWRSTSELVFVKNGIFQLRYNRNFYFCLGNMLPKNNRQHKCARNGWVVVKYR